MKKEICPICQKEIKPPECYWESVDACSSCVRKTALEIQNEIKNNPPKIIAKHKKDKVKEFYVFSKEDLDRAKIKWWQYPLLWVLPSYVQINEGYVFYFKYWRGRVFLMKVEKLPSLEPN